MLKLLLYNWMTQRMINTLSMHEEFPQQLCIIALINHSLRTMEHKTVKINKNSIKIFLENFYNKPVKILEYSELGSGWVATGYKVKFVLNKKSKQVAVRTLKPIDFSHDYPSDRAAYFWIQHESAKDLPSHIKSLGVIGVSA